MKTQCQLEVDFWWSNVKKNNNSWKLHVELSLDFQTEAIWLFTEVDLYFLFLWRAKTIDINSWAADPSGRSTLRDSTNRLHQEKSQRFLLFFCSFLKLDLQGSRCEN